MFVRVVRVMSACDLESFYPHSTRPLIMGEKLVKLLVGGYSLGSVGIGLGCTRTHHAQ